MDRRVHSGILAAVAALVAALAVPVVAGPAIAAPEPAFSPEMIGAVQRDLGLTAEEATARLTGEQRASETNSILRKELGARYAGGWVTGESTRLVVGVTDQAAAERVRAAGAEPRLVARGEARLEAERAKLDAHRARAPKSMASWYVDVTTNSVVVNTSSPAQARRFVASTGADQRAVRIVASTEAPRPFIDVVGGNAYYIGAGTRCSVGFSVTGGFVTAGHCGGTGASVAGWDGSAMGNFAGSSFPGNDYAFVRIGHGWWTAPVVLGWGTVPDQLVRGSWEAPVGSSVCRSGSTTRWHCGTVLAKNETVNYAQGAVHQMTKTSVCAQPGDSGGSFITGDQAQGVTSGGWGNCSTGGQTWFQPVNEILGVYGLSLVTA